MTNDKAGGATARVRDSPSKTPPAAKKNFSSVAVAVPAFDGIPLAALDFYEDLEDDNCRSFWMANKNRYTECVLEPLQRLAAKLSVEFGAAKIFRPYRDVRFAKDKTPYKTQQGIFFAQTSRYLHIDAEGLLLAGGDFRFSSDQLQRYRRALAAELPADALRGAIATFEAAGFTVSGDQLQRVPAGFDKSSPDADLLRRKSLIARCQLGAPAWLSTSAAPTEIATRWRSLNPFVSWLDSHVGPAEELRRR